MNGRDGPRIWIEIGDLLQYFREYSIPTGIPRVQLEIIPRMLDLAPDRVTVFEIGRNSRQVEILDFDETVRRYDDGAFRARFGRRARTYNALRYLRGQARNLVEAIRRRVSTGDRKRFAEMVRPGDVVLNLGGAWAHPHFGRSLGELKQDFGVRVAVLVHDVLPLTHASLTLPGAAPSFDRWFTEMSGVWDLLITPSESTARELRSVIEGRGAEVPPIRRIRFGAGFTKASILPVSAARTHVLYVSTIEVRKNHRLVFEIWKKLIAEHGEASVPDLVFAGKYGWKIGDLRRDLNATQFLNGKIRVVENLEDGELARLYTDACFTVFPSLCEGWGLPIGESLYFGRYCIASDATSIPEVGPGFTDHHPPNDFDAAYRLIEAALFVPGRLAAKEQHIRDRFVPRTWRETAGEIISVIDEFSADAPRPS